MTAIDYAAARNHFHTLAAAGWSLRAAAAHADVSATDLSRFMHGTDLPHVAVGIMRVDPATLPVKTTADGGRTAEPFVPRIGTVRRIQALLYMGWRHADLHERSGLVTRLLLCQQGRWVTRSTHDRIAALYRELSAKAGPSERTRRRARKLGYAGPLQWDDIDSDEAPEKDERLCAADGCLNLADWTFDERRHDEASRFCRRHGQENAA